MSQEGMVLFSLIGLHTVWVLLPLVPAILIYRLFPDTAVAVTGPLANLTVRASGAFGAYLIVFAATFPLVQQTEEAIGGFQRQFWTLRGTIKLIDTDGTELHSESLLAKMGFRTQPEVFSVSSSSLWLEIPENAGTFRAISLFIPEFGQGVINLSDSGVKLDRFKKTIDIQKPIMIQAIPKTVSPGSRSQVDIRTHETGATSSPANQ